MSFYELMERRRSHYSLKAESPISDERIRQIVAHSLKHAPSAFHAQSSRAVVLIGEEHRALWEIAMEQMRSIVPADSFGATEKKIKSFAAAYGTILFFEDQDTIRQLQERFPIFSGRFPDWSEQHAGILQFMVWTALEEAGLGANLQHYDPLIDSRVRERWDLPEGWKLMGQMPFGLSTARPGEKEFLPEKERLRVFGAQPSNGNA